MVLDYKNGKDKLLDFYYGPLFSKVANKIHYVCKSDIDQIRFTNKLLRGILGEELNPNQAKITLENSQLFDSSQITIILSILTTDVLDPLKEALDAVYNSNVTNNSNISTAEPAIQKPVEETIKIKQTFVPASPLVKLSSGDIDPLDMFDKAKSDIGTTSQKEEASVQNEKVVIQEREKMRTPKSFTTVENLIESSQEMKEAIPVNSNPIKINMAAVLGDEKNNNTLILQDNQAITQLSQLLKSNTPIIEREDLSLYVPNPENKEEAPKSLNPAAPENDTDEFPEEPLVPKPAVSLAPSTMALIDANVAKPKETTIGENISQSHLKFAQNNEQRIPANKSYSKLLDSMSQKPKNQPQIVTTLRDTFAHPERYSVPQEPPRPKPKKYTLPDENLVKSIVIDSSEKSSNKESNAIIEKEIDNDIINLAKDISQGGIANDKKINPETRGPIIYTKQKKREDDTFGRISSDKLDNEGKQKNSNIIDLS